MLARHSDVPNTYAKADQENNHDIYMKVPSGMLVSQDILDQHGCSQIKQVALFLKKNYVRIEASENIVKQVAAR